MKRLIFLSACCIYTVSVQAQDISPEEIFRKFKQEQVASYQDFRKDVNNRYTEFMREKWVWFNSEASIEDIENQVKPMPAPTAPDKEEIQTLKKEFIKYGKVIQKNRKKQTQPQPISPIQQVNQAEELLQFSCYGTKMKVRLKQTDKIIKL